MNWILKAVFLCSLLYALWSYSLTDPNLILSSWAPYWRFQQWMWQTLFHNRQLMTIAYGLLLGGFFGLYFFGLKLLMQPAAKKSAQFNSKKFLVGCLLAISPLFFSYNALSHDVFNYIFNAKMVVVYQANPHVKVALDFVQDDWTRFMHNTHTPAPYGYGWTVLSLIPYLIGFNKFLPTWLLFRGFAVLSLWLLFKVLQKISLAVNNKPLSATAAWLVFFNPLVLIEVIANQHNDLWMMIPALLALLLIFDKPKKLISTLIVSALLLAVSDSIKFATLVLTPLWGLSVLRGFIPKLQSIFTWQRLAFLASILLFLPLLTLRSQQFLPWYLLWSFVWLPFINQAWWKQWLIVFSLTAMLRYLPWLWAGGFTEVVLLQQKWLVWGGGVGLWLAGRLWSLSRRVRYNT